jgi:hypothetical protein
MLFVGIKIGQKEGIHDPQYHNVGLLEQWSCQNLRFFGLILQ